ncbi:MAG: hypothetical protein ABSG62_19210 [Terracidiphilus sp.]
MKLTRISRAPKAAAIWRAVAMTKRSLVKRAMGGYRASFLVAGHGLFDPFSAF